LSCRTPRDLVEFDRLEQGAEIAFAETLVALALDDLEEDRSDHVLGEDLQQQLALGVVAVAIDQDAQAAQFVEVLAVVRQAPVDQFVVGPDGVLERDAGVACAGPSVDIVGAERDVLDALAVVLVEVFGDLRLVVGGLVDRDADLPARRGHRLRLQARQPAFDVEVAHLAEVEQVLVELGPFLHAAAVHVVGQVVDVGQAVAGRAGLGAGNGDEVDVVDADVADRAGRRALEGVLAAPAVDEVQQRVADALDGRDVQFHRAVLVVEAPGAQFERAAVGKSGVVDADRDGADRLAVLAREALRERIGLGIDDEVDLALAIQGHVLVAMARDGGKAHLFEQRAHRFRIRRRVFDEFETVGSHRVVPRLKLHACLLDFVAHSIVRRGKH
jgi:hypothetical protein